MTLKELKQMIAEEFAAYNEAEDDVDVSVDDTDIDADTAGDEAGEDDVLRQIFDLLKTHFEGGDDEMGDEEQPQQQQQPEPEQPQESFQAANTISEEEKSLVQSMTKIMESVSDDKAEENEG